MTAQSSDFLFECAGSKTLTETRRRWGDPPCVDDRFGPSQTSSVTRRLGVAQDGRNVCRVPEIGTKALHLTHTRFWNCGWRRTCNDFPIMLKAKNLALAGREPLEFGRCRWERLQV